MMENSIYAQQYTQTIKFLLTILQNDIDKGDNLTSRLPIYISILNVIEEMRGGFLGVRPNISDGLDQNYLYQINNEAIKIVDDLIQKCASEGKSAEVLQNIQNQNKRVENLLK